LKRLTNNSESEKFKIMNDTQKALETVLTGEAAKLLHQHNATILARYGALRNELVDLSKLITSRKKRIDQIVVSTRKKLDPFYDRFDPTSQANMDDLGFFRFMNQIGGAILQYMQASKSRLELIDMYSLSLVPVLTGEKGSELASVVIAEEAGSDLLTQAALEYNNTVLGLERLLGSVYLGTRNEYSRLRRKFLGGTQNQTDDDDIENQLMASFFGSRAPKRENNGPAIALIDENVILTKLFLDIMDNMPVHYEKVVPILKRGKPTGKVEKTYTLEQGEIEDWASTLVAISDRNLWNYVNNPSELTKTFMDSIRSFYAEYNSIATAIRNLVLKANLHHGETRRVIDNPDVLVKQYNRINFLSIRPSAEDTAPRTKMDTDLLVIRTKLFEHLKETLSTLSGMNRFEDSTEHYSIEQLKKAIEFRKEMTDITKTEAQKALARNIEDENEFYVGKSGNLGSLSAEREPAPKITYEDVVGSSFVTAKQHVEEVIQVASHPNIMRLSAPRGNVKSNLLFIGPYGCGKTEIARAIGGDKRIIGFNVATADMLTAYMHESVKNIKRMYDCAKDLRKGSRYTKPVAILIDEIDRLFSYGEGVHQAYDGSRMTGVLQEMMDGVVDYEGVFLVGMTNNPKALPEAILRRFKYVDVVGQLTREERAKLFRKFLTRGLPVDENVSETNYLEWADMLNHAPGDVIGKVTDEIHFKFMHELVLYDSKLSATIERNLSKKLKDREAAKKDFSFLKTALSKFRVIEAPEVTKALELVIAQPQVKMQISKAKQVYRDAREIIDGLSVIEGGSLAFGASKKASWGA